mmetsp:Transcript_10784/g.28655  ORF Transcript_10784/g.28655 Transcript_10784/m.28655 type:complete len:283 (+) Transcript_10784:105-953(+)
MRAAAWLAVWAAAQEAWALGLRSNQALPAAPPVVPGGQCDLCGGKQQWLFIMATGRSGSTTMLEMLNAIPGFYLAGENYGLLEKVWQIYQSTMNASQRSQDGDARFHANPVSEHDLFCSLQLLVKATLGEFGADRTSVVGFKEIRHTSGKQRTFWKKVFPCARFIVNTRRNTTRQHNSQFQKFLSLSSLEAYTSDLELWQARHPEYVHKLQLESYSVGGFNQLLSSLGVSGCNFTDMAWANKRGDWRGDDTHARISGNCQISRWDTTGMDVLGPQDLNATVL